METASTSLMDMPDEVLLDILSYLSFDGIANMRPVCSRIDDICVQILNKEFQKTIIEHRKLSLTVKPPSSMFYVLRYEVRLLKKLERTLGFYVRQGYCAFYPGEILDTARASRCRSKYRWYLTDYEFSKQVEKAIVHFTTCIKPRFKRTQLNLRKKAVNK